MAAVVGSVEVVGVVVVVVVVVDVVEVDVEVVLVVVAEEEEEESVEEDEEGVVFLTLKSGPGSLRWTGFGGGAMTGASRPKRRSQSFSRCQAVEEEREEEEEEEEEVGGDEMEVGE